MDGGIPPDCLVSPPGCDLLDCGFGICVLDSKGNPVCQCYQKKKACNVNERCNPELECECNDGQAPPCEPFCSKECKPGSICLKVEGESEEICSCLNGGKYPNCKKCSKKCRDGEVCGLNSAGKEICICTGTLQDKCPSICSKKCPGGKCAMLSDGSEICICYDNSRNYPKCDNPCNKKDCRKGKCIIENGKAVCICRNGSKNYPDCNNCEELDCENNNGKCVITQGGNNKCICKNGQSNYPECREQSCTCPPTADCVFIGNKTGLILLYIRNF